jgi:WD40 repeat protein
LAIYVFKLPEMNIARIWTGHEYSISALAWNPQNQKQCVSAGAEGVVYIWNMNSDTREYEAKLFCPAVHLQFNPNDANTFLALLENGEVHSFSISGNKVVKLFAMEKPGCAIRFNLLAV